MAKMKDWFVHVWPSESIPLLRGLLPVRAASPEDAALDATGDWVRSNYKAQGPFQVRVWAFRQSRKWAGGWLVDYVDCGAPIADGRFMKLVSRLPTPPMGAERTRYLTDEEVQQIRESRGGPYAQG